MTTPQMDWLDDQRRKRAVSSDDIVTRLRRLVDVPHGVDMLEAADEIQLLRAVAALAERRCLRLNDAADEIERLRAAIDAVLLAITDKGSHPEYHDEVRRRHEREWPTLWRAIAAMNEARQ